MVAFLLSSARTLVRRGVPTVALVLLKSDTARCDGPTTSSGSAGRVFEDGLSNLSSPEDSAGDLEPASGLFGTRIPLAALVSADGPPILTAEQRRIIEKPGTDKHALECEITSEYGCYWPRSPSLTTTKCNVCGGWIRRREVIDVALAMVCPSCAIKLCRQFGTHGVEAGKPATFTKVLECCPTNSRPTRPPGCGTVESRRAAGWQCAPVRDFAAEKQRALELHGCRTHKELEKLMGWANSSKNYTGLELMVMSQLAMVAIERMPRKLSTWALAFLFRDQLDVHGARVAAAVAAVKAPEVAMFDVEKLQLHRLPGAVSLEDVAAIKEYNPRLTTETFVGMVSTETASPVGKALVDELPEPGSFALSERQVQLEHDALVALRNRTTSSGAPVTLFHWNGDEGARCNDAGYAEHIDACLMLQQFLGLSGSGSYKGKLPSFEGEVLAWSCAQNVFSRCVEEGARPDHSAKGDCKTTPPTFLGPNKLLDIASQLAKFEGDFEKHPMMDEARKRLLTEIKSEAVIQEAAKRKAIYLKWLADFEEREAKRAAEGEEARKSAKSAESVKVQATGDPWSKSKPKSK